MRDGRVFAGKDHIQHNGRAQRDNGFGRLYRARNLYHDHSRYHGDIKSFGYHR